MKQVWGKKKLHLLVDRLTNGYVGATKNIYQETGIPYLLARHVKNNILTFDERTYVSEHFNLKNKKSILKEGDVLLVQSGHIGHSSVVPKMHEGHNCHAMIVITPKSNFITGDFLSLYFLSPFMKQQFESLKTGSTIKHLNCKVVREVEIPFPPLPEQKRIVAILDKAFATIAKAKANAEQNLKNAKELFESYLQGVFENKGEDWAEKTLGDIADVEYGYTDKSTGEGDYRYIRITDIDKNGELILESKKYIKHTKEAKKFLIEENDLLMARTGATFAKVLLYKAYEPSVFASYLIRIKFKEKIKNELYWYFTKTNYYWEQANSLSSGAAQPHFNGAAVKQVVFSYRKSIK